MPMTITKAMANNTMNNVQELHTFKVTLIISFSSILFLHSSTNLSTNFFLHLQFS